MKKTVSLLLICGSILGCGVRGDPVPPGTPAELGRGKPSYRRASEDLAFPVPTPPPPGQREDDDEQDEE